MNERTYILFFFGALGAFNGLVLGSYFAFFPRKKNLSSFFLGCLLIALSVRIGKSVFVYFNPGLAKIYLQIGLSACFLIGPALYFFIKASLEQPLQLPRNWKYQLIALGSVVLTVGILFPYASYPDLWNRYFVKIIYGEWLVYLVFSGMQLKDSATQVVRTKASVKAAEKWLLAVFSANVIIFLSFLLSLFFGRLYNIYFSGALIFSFILYSMLFIFLYKAKADDPLYLTLKKNTPKK